MGGDYEDKVEATAPKAKKSSANTGGVATADADAVITQGLRIHKNYGQVHFHDDKAGAKCYVPVSVWWSAWQKLRNPVGSTSETFVYADLDNATRLTVTTSLDNHAVKVGMFVEAYTPPSTYDRIWHALESFTNKSGSR